MARKVAVVPHTHWDREWYAPFPAFQYRLVDELDRFLAHLDADPSCAHFLLDGQMAVIDDYLAARPGALDDLRRLSAEGRVTVGPWYALMDEFLVSGETIVRNLQLGLDRASSFGGAMPVGYLPDMFGHVAQMPQLLRQAGLAHAVVWRGVPAAVTGTAFWWRSPDGSTVRAEYLPVGYGNGASLPRDAASLVRRLRAHEAELSPFLASEDRPILLMNGTDHQLPPAWLGSLLAEANDSQKDFELEITSLPEYLAHGHTEALGSWSGELRSGARANLLMGVVSNRMDIRAAAARCERALERLAEPLAALWLPAGRWPATLLADAWTDVIRNSAHDSICACSTDEVAIAVNHRFAEATAIGSAVIGDAVSVAGSALSAVGPVVVNPAARRRSGVVELVVSGNDAPAGTQVVETIPAGATERTGLGSDLARFLGELSADGWLVDGKPTNATVDWSPYGVELTLEVDASRPVGPATAPVMAEAWAQAGANKDRPLRVRVQRAPSQRVLVRAANVPGFGWKRWEPVALDSAPVSGENGWLDNGLVNLAVDPADGTFSINGCSGLGRLVDDGDAGDTYNYSPPATDVLVDRPETVAVELVEAGPVRGRIRVTRRYRWPSAVVDGRRAGGEDVEVVTDLELRTGEPLVRVETRFDNRCRDHRLRVWFPLPEPADHSIAECAFATVRRGLEAEGGPHERALATFPSRRFVTAGGLYVTHEGLPEYELVEGGTALAVTVLRATGMLSRPAPSWRPNAAGPALAVDGPQLVGPVVARLAVAVTGPAADWYDLADLAWLPLLTVDATGAGTLPTEGSHLAVSGAEVSSLRRVGPSLELRVFNPTDEATIVRVEGRNGWLVDLRGRPVEAWDGEFALRPWGIATARFGPAEREDATR
jgi:hypothetical protein